CCHHLKEELQALSFYTHQSVQAGGHRDDVVVISSDKVEGSGDWNSPPSIKRRLVVKERFHKRTQFLQDGNG
nr:hypothetical protein [Tanacetum cinerariifolium]